MTWLPDPDLQRDLQNAVTRLPGTADGIAAELAARGVKAQRYCTTGCALAVYFARETGADKASVLFRATVRTGDRFAQVTLPVAATEFLLAFDRGEYPGLVERDENELLEATA